MGYISTSESDALDLLLKLKKALKKCLDVDSFYYQVNIYIYFMFLQGTLTTDFKRKQNKVRSRCF